jgi:hypothetical protein
VSRRRTAREASAEAKQGGWRPNPRVGPLAPAAARPGGGRATRERRCAGRKACHACAEAQASRRCRRPPAGRMCAARPALRGVAPPGRTISARHALQAAALAADARRHTHGAGSRRLVWRVTWHHRSTVADARCGAALHAAAAQRAPASSASSLAPLVAPHARPLLICMRSSGGCSLAARGFQPSMATLR